MIISTSGILFDFGPILMKQRSFTLRHLRQLGYGKSSSQTIIQDEVVDLLKKIKAESDSNPDSIVDFKSIFRLPNLNIIWAFVAGKRFQSDDKEFSKLTDSIGLIGRGLNLFLALLLPIPENVLNVFPTRVRTMLGACTENYQPVTKLLTVRSSNSFLI